MLLILSPIISKVASRGWAASVDTTLIDVAPATSKPTSEPTTILVTKAEMKISFMTTVRLLKKINILGRYNRDILKSIKSKLKIEFVDY